MKVHRHELGDGDDQIDGTVEHMIRLAKEDTKHQTIKRIADRLAKKTKSDAEYARAAFDHVVAEITYKLDNWKGNPIEVVAAPRHTLAGDRKFGDCDCMITALTCLLLIRKIKTMIKVVAWKPERRDEFTHVYMLYYDRDAKAWIPMDPTAGRSGFGWEVSPLYREKHYPV